MTAPSAQDAAQERSRRTARDSTNHSGVPHLRPPRWTLLLLLVLLLPQLLEHVPMLTLAPLGLFGRGGEHLDVHSKSLFRVVKALPKRIIVCVVTQRRQQHCCEGWMPFRDASM